MKQHVLSSFNFYQQTLDDEHTGPDQLGPGGHFVLELRVEAQLVALPAHFKDSRISEELSQDDVIDDSFVGAVQHEGHFVDDRATDAMAPGIFFRSKADSFPFNSSSNFSHVSTKLNPIR